MVLSCKEEFLADFMKISANLTSSELRMLYVILKEPEVLNLSQEQFAKRISASRRTINIGLKKLRELNLINALDDKTVADLSIQSRINENNMLKGDLKQAGKYVQKVFKEHYNRNPNNIVVNEDFFSRILGDYGLNREIQYNRDFIIQTIKGFAPDCIFYFDKSRDSYASEEQYFIINKINIEIRSATVKGSYYLHKSKVMDFFSENYSFSEEDVIRVIRNNFQGLRFAGERIRINKPFKGGKVIG